MPQNIRSPCGGRLRLHAPGFQIKGQKKCLDAPLLPASSPVEKDVGKDELTNDAAKSEGQPAHEHILQRPLPPSRRIHSRVEARGGVFVYWRSAGDEDVAPVRNLSMGGLFIETDAPKVPGIEAKLHFLVQEGQIIADAVVRHAEPGRGLGLRFTAVRNEDRQRLAELMKRLRRSS
jgi:hypothetical protein